MNSNLPENNLPLHMEQTEDRKKVIDFGVLVGERLLANGCGTHRIHDVIARIYDVGDVYDRDIMVTTTGIVVTLNSENGMITVVKQVPKKTMHTTRIALIEGMVGDYEAGNLTIDEAIEQLENIRSGSPYPVWFFILSYGLTACFRSIMFGGSVLDGLVSIVVGTCMGYVVRQFAKNKMVEFLCNYAGGFTAGFLSVLAGRLSVALMPEMILLGSLMPIAPGVPLLHSTNDILHGDYTSGMTRAYESILRGSSIGAGIASAYLIWSFIGGGV